MLIFIDESGTLPDPKDKFIILAAIAVTDKNPLLQVAKKTRQKIQYLKKDKNIGEIKFYRAGEKTKRIYLQELSKQPIEIFVLIIEKPNQMIADNPAIFAAISGILLKKCFSKYGDKIKKIVFDKHFHREIDQVRFDEGLEHFLNRKLNIVHANSVNNPEIIAPDMVAGSLLRQYSKGDRQFSSLIKNKIINIQKYQWKELNKKLKINKNPR